MKGDNTELFERLSMPRAIVTLAVPTVISQIITVVYNMADTFFIGRMNDPHQVAAATLAVPPFILLTAIANLFGIGGCSLVSRLLGRGERKKAGRCAAFSIYGALSVAVVYGILLFFSRPWLLPLLGTNAGTYDYCADYVFWTVTVGAAPTVLSAVLAHLVRAEGYAREASIGLGLGGVLNILLDPLLIFPLGLGLMGAAVATMLSNVAACIYFLLLLRRKRESTVIGLDPRRFTLGGGIPREVLLVGFPSCVMSMMSILSNAVLNGVVAYSNQAMAGTGIAKKIDTLAFAVANGLTQGVLPLIAYNYASGNRRRMHSAIRTAFMVAVSVSTAATLLLFTCAVPVVRFFINDSATIAYGQHFLRVICLTCPAIAVTMMIICVFQATGQKGKPLFLSMLRKGLLDVPLMLLLDYLFAAQGIPWATAGADILAMLLALALFIPYWKTIR
ncbi:MAG: polysaccharide biosynthesis C-terminal domain-containing protein [Oscillospiraceae bacterium]|nr:polysaccharide biosynthesis C-terminal domain-containing protein [Oscillospiraceae bacterium]